MDAKLKYILYRLPDDLYFKITKIAHEETLAIIKTIYNFEGIVQSYNYSECSVLKAAYMWSPNGVGSDGWGSLRITRFSNVNWPRNDAD